MGQLGKEGLVAGNLPRGALSVQLTVYTKGCNQRPSRIGPGKLAGLHHVAQQGDLGVSLEKGTGDG